MSKSSLKTRIARIAAEIGNSGFGLCGWNTLKRSFPYLEQFIEFQPGAGDLRDRFTCAVAWKITADNVPSADVYDFVVRLGQVSDGRDIWWSCELKEIDSSVAQVRRLILEVGIPFLDRYASLDSLVRAYELKAESEDRATDATSPLLFFGIDAGWKNHNLGLTYGVLGEREKARRHLVAVVEKHSDREFDFVQRRKAKCLAALERL